MYRAIDDPYRYPGSDVLRNRLNIRDRELLEAFEAEMTAVRFSEPLPAGRLSVSHYKALHRHLFQDVYPWAGRFRRVRLAKDDSVFCYPEHIAGQMRELFAWLKDRHFLTGLDAEAFARDAAHFLAELNAIHAFREGNGRTQLAFMGCLAVNAGHPLDFGALQPELFLEAMIASFAGREAALAAQILAMVEGADGLPP